MAKKIKQGFGKIVKTLLKVLGITSIITACGNGGIDQIDVYGMPPNQYTDYQEFTLEGTITDKAGNPIKGINLTVMDDITEETEVKDGTRGQWTDTYNDRTYYFVYDETDADGKYKLCWKRGYKYGDRFTLEISDEDGDENGLFNNQFIPLYFEDFDIKNNGDTTSYTKNNADYSLSPKETEEL
ncbi:MAG: hypothetical protein J5780_03865 [Treponema sp.]|nr:hypothetical protein [Treponema sp.]